MTAAYKDALRVPQLTDRNDTVTEIIAEAIIQIARTGERDPVQLREAAIATFASIVRVKDRR
jgi:hypothetical protein